MRWFWVVGAGLVVCVGGCGDEVTYFPGGDGGGSSSATGSGTGGGGAAGAGGSGGSTAGECGAPGDCFLFQDCCDCYAVPVGTEPESCLASCEVPACDADGATTAVCEYGTCTVQKEYSCNQADAQCWGVPPDCPADQLPEVADACWTGQCVPAWLCDVVTDCSYCLATEICVHSFLDGPNGPWYSCRALPAACPETPSCACASFICDQGGFTTCTDIPGGIYCGF